MHHIFQHWIKKNIINFSTLTPNLWIWMIDIGWGMMTILIWKKACIDLFITYFNIDLKRTKLISHTHTPNLWICLNNNCWNDIFQMTIDSWVEVTSWGSQEAWYRVIRVLRRYLAMGWYRCGTSGVYVRTKLMLLLINVW